MSLTHVNEKNQPGMVDVSQKDRTRRVAKAQSLIEVGPRDGLAIRRRYPEQKRTRFPHCDHRRNHGGKKNIGSHPVLPSDSTRRLQNRNCRTRIPSQYDFNHLHLRYNLPHRYRNGGSRRSLGSCAHPLRHVQGSFQIHAYSRHQTPAQNWWKIWRLPLRVIQFSQFNFSTHDLCRQVDNLPHNQLFQP